MLEDIAIATGGRVIARDLGGSIAGVQMRDLGRARQVTVSANQTTIRAGGGDPATVKARREQVARQYEAAPQNIERDKFQVRLAKLSGGTAIILAGGATPVEQKRRVQLIEDAINATRAAVEEGIVPGGGTALLQVVPDLERVVDSLSGSAREGAGLLQSALAQPLTCIAKQLRTGCRRDRRAGAAVTPRRGLRRAHRRVHRPDRGRRDRPGARHRHRGVRNAASVAGLILTTQTLIATKPDGVDITAGPAMGGGAELL